MTTRSVRLDDIAYALGSVKLLSPEDFQTGKAERVVISLPGWLFDDGRPRKRTIDVGPAGRRYLDKIKEDIRKAGGLVYSILTENAPEEEPEEAPDDSADTSETTPKDTTKKTDPEPDTDSQDSPDDTSTAHPTPTPPTITPGGAAGFGGAFS